MRKICIEEHWKNRELEEIAEKWGARNGIPPEQDSRLQSSSPTSIRAMDFERYRLPLMDEAGVTMQVLSTGSPGIQGVEDAATAIAAARRINDIQNEIIFKHPGRFAGFASLPTQDPGAAADELERTVTQLGFKGAMIQGHTNGEYLDQDKFRVLWERSEALGTPIYLHISDSPWSRTIYEHHPELRLWSWGVEAATHALRIIAAGVFDAFPRATLILGHLGESLPYLLGRINQRNATVDKGGRLNKTLAEYIRENILVTTSARYDPEALVCAVHALGADRVLFATDYPYVTPREAVGFIEKAPLTNEEKEQIYHLNAERWLKL